ncbi:MAG TPA: hypothetical protein VFP84_27830 [Kofleriaceae bacterium]|nr:hypothetical protein [Kofleriaceae bacterium]
MSAMMTRGIDMSLVLVRVGDVRPSGVGQQGLPEIFELIDHGLGGLEIERCEHVRELRERRGEDAARLVGERRRGGERVLDLVEKLLVRARDRERGAAHGRVDVGRLGREGFAIGVGFGFGFVCGVGRGDVFDLDRARRRRPLPRGGEARGIEERVEVEALIDVGH